TLPRRPTQKALNLALLFFVKLFCLAHASSSPYKRSSDPPLLNAALFMRLALPSHTRQRQFRP
ncbi:TPA: hypothetical protein R0G39_000843, partial [Campylobacter upsaliensis]|nr:hypothetical protein [Campylobacter upsaliensis]